MYNRRCHVSGSSICGDIDVKTGECKFCFDRDHDLEIKSERNEGIWLGIGIGFLASGLLVWIMEYFVG